MFETFWLKVQGAWKSLTIWANTVFLSVIGLAEPLKEMIPQAQAYLTPDTYKYAFLGMIVLNIALRFKTTKDLAAK